MFAVATAQGGMCQAFPNVDKVPAPPAPPIPVPFPSIVQCATALNVAQRVKVLNMPVIVKNSQWPTSLGDPPGVAGGTVSGVNMGPVTIKDASALLYVEGGQAFLHGKTSAHNGTNANMPMGMQVSPSQAKLFAAR